MLKFMYGDGFDALDELVSLDGKVMSDCMAESYLDALCVFETLSIQGFNYVRNLKGWERLGHDDLWLYKSRCIVLYCVIPGDGRGETLNPVIVLSSFCAERGKLRQSLGVETKNRISGKKGIRTWE